MVRSQRNVVTHIFSAISLLILFLPMLVGAQAQLQNPLGAGTTLIGFIQDLVDAILILVVPIIVFFIIYAGFLYVTARGNSEAVSKAHRALLYAVIGGVIVLGATVLTSVIEGTVDAIRNST